MRFRASMVVAVVAAGLILLAAMVVSTAGTGLSLQPSCVTQGCHRGTTTSVGAAGSPTEPVVSCIKSASCGGGAALAFSSATGLLFFAVAGGVALARSRPRIDRGRGERAALLLTGARALLLRPPQAV